jgi:hypothetical protein
LAVAVLADVPAGSNVLLDANVLIYAISGDFDGIEWLTVYRPADIA